MSIATWYSNNVNSAIVHLIKYKFTNLKSLRQIRFILRIFQHISYRFEGCITKFPSFLSRTISSHLTSDLLSRKTTVGSIFNDHVMIMFYLFSFLFRFICMSIAFRYISLYLCRFCFLPSLILSIFEGSVISSLLFCSLTWLTCSIFQKFM